MKHIWFYKPTLYWFGPWTLWPIHIGSDEHYRRTLMLGWTITGRIVIAMGRPDSDLIDALAEVERLKAETVCSGCGVNIETMSGMPWHKLVGRLEATKIERDALTAKLARVESLLDLDGLRPTDYAGLPSMDVAIRIIKTVLAALDGETKPGEPDERDHDAAQSDFEYVCRRSDIGYPTLTDSQ